MFIVWQISLYMQKRWHIICTYCWAWPIPWLFRWLWIWFVFPTLGWPWMFPSFCFYFFIKIMWIMLGGNSFFALDWTKVMKPLSPSILFWSAAAYSDTSTSISDFSALIFSCKLLVKGFYATFKIWRPWNIFEMS